jgi:diguanylate cyclase (GGDEF)-like protein
MSAIADNLSAGPWAHNATHAAGVAKHGGRMSAQGASGELDPEILLEIIRVQTDIARLDLDLGRIMHVAAAEARRLTDADGAAVELVEDHEMVYRAADGLAERELGLRVRRVGSLSGLCVEAKAVLKCDDSEIDSRVDREACRKTGLRSMAVAPLLHGDLPIGVLKIMAAEPDGFGEREMRILELVSGIIAAEMGHAAAMEASALYHRATHDPLTGLANRALFFDRLRQEIAACERGGQVGLLALDLDNLKAINDLYGHRAGDAALREVGERLTRALSRYETAARFGGDEFAVIVHDVADRPSLLARAQRLGEQLNRPFVFRDRSLSLSASIGTALFPDDGSDPDDFLEHADRAMYAAKRVRRTGLTVVYEAAARPAALESGRD